MQSDSPFAAGPPGLPRSATDAAIIVEALLHQRAETVGAHAWTRARGRQMVMIAAGIDEMTYRNTGEGEPKSRKVLTARKYPVYDAGPRAGCCPHETLTCPA